MTVRAAIALLLIGAGILTILVAVLGLFRLKGALNRMHAAAMVDTMGLLCVLCGLMVLCGLTVHTAKLALVLLLVWLSSPISSHLVARTELLTARDIDADSLKEKGEIPL